jgi:DNA-binding NtrC family response regulator
MYVMKKQPAIATNHAEIVSVLSVSPAAEDHSSLQYIFNHSNWKLHKTHGLLAAVAFLKAQKTPVVLCECNLLPGTWRDLLKEIYNLPLAPTLIVGSRIADDRLWAEALNPCAWDVLAKPFEKSELLRSVSVAWQHWKQRQERSATIKGRIRTAS